MEFGSFKIDLSALAALVTAITTVIFAVKGKKLNNKKKKEEQDAE